MKLFNSVASLGTKFLRIFFPAPMPLSTKYAPRLGGTPWEVDHWTEHMIPHFQSQEDVRNLTVDEIVFYKENDLVAHEYLILKVKSPQSPGRALLKIERSLLPGVLKELVENPDTVAALYGDNTHLEVDQEEIRTQLRIKIKNLEDQLRKSMYQSIESSSKKSNEPRLAADHVFHITQYESHTVLSTLKFGEASPLTLRDVAIVVSTVHNSAPVYEWRTRNCYWFAKTAVDIIQEIANPLPSNFPINSQQGRPGYIGIRPTILSPRPPFDFRPLVDPIKEAIREDDERIRKIHEQAAGQVEREARWVEREAGLVEQVAGLVEREAGLVEQVAGLVERDAEWSQKVKDLTQQLAAARAAQVPGPSST